MVGANDWILKFLEFEKNFNLGKSLESLCEFTQHA